MSDKLSNAERLFLTRRREGKNQRQMAERLGFSRTRYSEMELGLQPIPPDCRFALGKVLPLERCILKRRRANISQQELADVLGCCRHQVVLMENGRADAKRLVDFWGT